MTTVAARDGVMAADSQSTGDYICRVRKILRLPDGTLAAGAGTSAAVYAAIQWVIGGRQGDAPDIEGSCVLFLRPNGSLWLADGRWPEFPLADKHIAIGSGGMAAQAAMLMGASAIEAVRIACHLDDGSSAPVHSAKLKTVN